MSLGIQHTISAVKGLSELSVIIIKIAKNGISFSDMILISSKISNIRKIFKDFPEDIEELKDLDTEEMKQLAILVTEEIDKISKEVLK